MNLIKKKVDESLKIIDLFRDYINYFEIGFDKVKSEVVNNLKNMINNKYPEKRRKLLERVEALNIDTFSELELSQQQKLIFQTYALLKQFDNILDDIYNIVDKYSFATSEFVDSDLSSTTKHNSINQEQIIKKHYIDYLKTYKKITQVNVTDKFSDILINSIMKNSDQKNMEQLENINSLFIKYPETIQLFAHVMQTTIDRYSHDKDVQSKNIISFIMELIEHDKAKVLQHFHDISADKRIEEKRKIKIGSRNPFLRRFGLVPSGNFIPIKDLFSNMKNLQKERDHPEAIFKKIHKETKVGIIVLQNITHNPISYELWNLFNTNTIMSANSGITEDFIKSRVTIHPLEPDKKWIFSSYQFFGSLDSQQFYIIETLNDTLYRFLYPWIIKSYEDKTQKDRISIHYRKINGLLNYLEINKEYEKCEDRITIYQKIKEKNLEKMFFKTGEPNIDALVKESLVHIDSSKIKSESIFRIRDVINKMIKNAKNPLDTITFVIYNNKIFDTFINTVISMYKEFYIVKDDTRVSFGFSEVFSTYLSDIQNLKSSFSKELNDIYLKKIEEERKEIESITDKHKLLIYIENIINETLDKILTYNSNIYQSLIFKSNLLKVGII